MKNILKKINKFPILLIILFIFNKASAENKFVIIRDDEIEFTIAKLIEPLFIAAKIDPKTIKILIVDDQTINAFVTNQNMLFIHSGLLIKFYDDPDIIMGVVAHELGHILGGHLAKLNIRYKDIATNSAVSAVMLGVIGFGASAPELAIAAINGALHAGNRSMLSYSRQQELLADKIATELIERSKNSSIGLKKIMDYFRKIDSNLYGKINPYILTHPIATEHLQFITNYMEKTKYPHSMVRHDIKNQYVRSAMKLNAFLYPNKSAIDKSKIVESDDLYAKSIINFKNNNLAQSLKFIDKLIIREPLNAYFYELKAQILFENGNIVDSLAQYQKAFSLRSCNLIGYEYAAALIEAVDMNKIHNNNLDLAINLLSKIDQNGEIFFENLDLLARAYGKKGQIGIANYYLAKMYLIAGDEIKSKKFAKIATKSLSKIDPYYIKAMDILE